MLKLALLGCGRIGQVHARSISQLADKARLVAVADAYEPAAQELAAASGAEVRSSAQIMQSNDVDAVIVGSDRIARNGDVCNKIGTYLKALAASLIQSFLRHTLRDGFFHADMHPGNLFVEADGTIVAVDLGIAGRLGKKERRFLAEILYGFITRDYLRVAEVHFEAGYVPRTQDVASFAQALRAIGEPIYGQPAETISMGHLLALLFEVTELFDMRARPELVLLQKTMMTVEGVARRIDPDHDIWAAADPVVRRWIARELAPPAQARRAVQESLDILHGLKRRLQSPEPPVAVVAPERDSGWLWFFLGALTAGGAFLLGALA